MVKKMSIHQINKEWILTASEQFSNGLDNDCEPFMLISNLENEKELLEMIEYILSLYKEGHSQTFEKGDKFRKVLKLARCNSYKKFYSLCTAISVYMDDSEIILHPWYRNKKNQGLSFIPNSEIKLPISEKPNLVSHLKELFAKTEEISQKIVAEGKPKK
jgi:hypothetical protein